MRDKELKYYLKKLEVSKSDNDNILGDTLILSCAGGGKTTALIERVKKLISLGVEQKKILVLTFTRKSAEDFRDRVDDSLNVSTFHSFAFKLLKENYEYFKILTEKDKEIVESYLEHESLLWYRKEFFNYKNYLSFNGIIERLNRILSEEPQFREFLSNSYPFVLVDEYQDSDSLQIEFLKILNRSGSKITLAGDDSQSIYSFRGGSYKSILFYKRDFPYGRVNLLEKNYRSTKEIVRFTNDILEMMNFKIHKNNISQKKNGRKPLIIKVSNLKDEGEYLAILIKKLLREKEPSETIGVLYRNKNLVEHIENSFKNYNINYKKRVEKISKEDRVLEEFENFYNFFRRINSENLEKIRLEILEDTFEKTIKTSDILKVLEKIKKRELEVLDENFKKEFGRYFYILKLYLEKKSKLDEFLEVYKILHCEKLDLKWRVECIKEKIDITREKKDEKLFLNDYVELITTHSSKGLQWDYVFLTSVTEGVYPSVPNDREEELRIFYVGCSRAKKELTLISPQIIHWFLNDLSGTSSFIKSLDSNNYDLKDKCEIVREKR